MNLLYLINTIYQVDGFYGQRGLQMRMDAVARIRYEGRLNGHWPFAKTFARTPDFFNTMQILTVAVTRVVTFKDLPATMVARQMFTNIQRF